ncbi:hypothetical protein N7539_003027 [Penicillium diatomitis]|uniref:Uncharacterized protein n=1 Tax=Penicillium diatomitis TaxID=2819901 RepID=A0A9W9XFS8_9EURO|nr:uncharacterized protein N7539_003027 [Penicillium diatomitis]KAJ5491460.1 hypothetical protein N7539_003027 [Penicillium diatomitis]
MPPIEIKANGLPDLTNLVSWVYMSAKLEPEKRKKNPQFAWIRPRETKVRPFLAKLGYANIPVIYFRLGKKFFLPKLYQKMILDLRTKVILFSKKKYLSYG